jgi:uncharacterized protein
VRSRIALVGALCACVVLVGGSSAAGSGTVSLTAIGAAAAQSFDPSADFTGLATTGTTNTTLPTGWFLAESGTSSLNNDAYAAGTGSGTAGDVYSFGGASSTERAFGTLRSGTLIPIIGAQFANNTGQTIGQLAVSYAGEQWRFGCTACATTGRADRLDFQISTDATSLTTGTWTDADALDFSSPITLGAAAVALDGNAAANRTAVAATVPASIAAGSAFWIRWIDFDPAGSDDGLAVDDFSLTPLATDAAPSVSSTTPANGANNVALASNIDITFSEPVNLTGSWFSISCSTSGSHTATATTGTTVFTLDPDSDFALGDTCTVTVFAASVTDLDGNDPPDNMAADYVFSFTTPPAVTTGVLISEVYGGGGNAGSNYKNDFIELYNPTAAPISLTGWSVQYASSAGTSWQVTALTGSIPAGSNYLVQEAAGTTGADLFLPAPDATGSIAMAAGAGKVALVASTTALSGACPTGGAIVDFVGFGSAANCSETAPTTTLTNATSAKRKNGGAQDTNDNSSDFAAGEPDPRGTTNPAPTVASTNPANGTSNVGLGANVVVSFSEPVSVSGSWFSISCATSGAQSAAATANTGAPGDYRFTLDPSADFVANEACTVTIVAAQVADRGVPGDTMAADYVFSFTTADPSVCGDPATLIHEIQGSGAAAPPSMLGTSRAIEGVVVGDYQDTTAEFGGFYLQEEDGQVDADPNTSEGIFVFANGFGPDVKRGDVVRVRGTVAEFNGLTELNAVNAVSLCSTGNPLPDATAVSLPVASFDELERREGMLVHFDQTLTATEVFNLGRFGEVSLSGVGRLYSPSAVVMPGAAAEAKRDENNRSRIILDDGNSQQDIDPTRYPQGGLTASNTLRVGDTLPGLTGVMDFGFSNYRIQPVGPLTWAHTNPRTPAPDPVGGNLRIASFNVLNYFNGNGTHQEGMPGGFPTSRGANSLVEFNRQTAKEVSALTAMNADVVGLMEIENDAGPNSALADLVTALNAASAPGTYSYIDTGVIGTDEIKVALIYKPAAVTPVGDWKILTSAVDPRFIDTRNRPSLAQTFLQNASGEKLTVVVNHLKSKGSGCGAGDDIADASGGNCTGTRTLAAQALVDWLGTDPTGSGDPDFLLIGDMNSYAFESPIQAFEAGGLTNLVRKLDGLTAYSYVFNGESGYLDHALATGSLEAQVAGVSHWHINPDEPTVLDYNVEFKTPNHIDTFYAPDAYRSSDHDPVVIGLDLDTNAAPSVDAGGPYSVDEGGVTLVNAAGNDPDGDTLTYEWDLDANGSFETSGQSVLFDATAIDGLVSRTIKVRATDPDGLSSESTASVTIENVEPSATFDAPASAFAGLPFTIALTDPSDPAPADTFTYAFDCGTVDGAFAGTSSTTCTSTSTGPLTVRGTIKDDDGGFTPYTATVSVVVTYDSLCELTRLYVTKADVENGLCDKLASAEDADAAGRPKAKDKALDAYVKQVRGQSGRSLTAAQADTLISLARQL